MCLLACLLLFFVCFNYNLSDLCLSRHRRHPAWAYLKVFDFYLLLNWWVYNKTLLVEKRLSGISFSQVEWVSLWRSTNSISISIWIWIWISVSCRLSWVSFLLQILSRSLGEREKQFLVVSVAMHFSCCRCHEFSKWIQREKNETGKVKRLGISRLQPFAFLGFWLFFFWFFLGCRINCKRKSAHRTQQASLFLWSSEVT